MAFDVAAVQRSNPVVEMRRPVPLRATPASAPVFGRDHAAAIGFAAAAGLTTAVTLVSTRTLAPLSLGVIGTVGLVGAGIGLLAHGSREATAGMAIGATAVGVAGGAALLRTSARGGFFGLAMGGIAGAALGSILGAGVAKALR